MGQWYCCNDSFVSLSTLQDVLSEKAYILFFSRSNQRPASAKTLVTSNGTTSHEVNGCETSKSQKFIGPLHNANTKPRAEQSFQKENQASPKPHKFIRPLKDVNILKPRPEQNLHKDNLISSKVEKAPLKPHAKVVISVNLGAKRVTPSVSGRLLSFHQDQNIAPAADKENSVSVSPTRVHSCSEKTTGTENGVKENGSAPGGSSNNHDEVGIASSSNGGNHHEDSLNPCESNGSQNGTTHHQKGNLNPCESNGSQNGTTHHQEIEKEGVSTTIQSEASSSSTNEDPCILLRKDESSRDKLEAVKERYLLFFFSLCLLL